MNEIPDFNNWDNGWINELDEQEGFLSNKKFKELWINPNEEKADNFKFSEQDNRQLLLENAKNRIEELLGEQ